jgi:hypothetical protein
VGFGPWGFKSLRPHYRSRRALARYDPAPSGAVAQLAKAPVSKTGDSRFESWLPRLIVAPELLLARVASSAKHLSIRVPWHDRGWDGAVCDNPSGNEACLALARIRETRDDRWQDQQAGKPWPQLESDHLPPCARERGSFMSSHEVSVLAEHPYSRSSEPHKHLEPTSMRIPAHAAGCVPFRWMLRDEAVDLAVAHGIDFDDRLEDAARKLMNFDSAWVQDGKNQAAMLDAFFGKIEVEESLGLFYAERVPLSEDSGKALVGVGRVTHVGGNLLYKNSEAGPFNTLLWERMVQHSVRPDHSDGFLLPYHEILEAAGENHGIEPADFVARVPDEAWGEFSYGSEHVSNDSAIAALVACRQALERAAEAIPGSRSKELEWIDGQLAKLWKLRGPCPGLGSALTAFGVEHGTLLVHRMAAKFEQGGDPWPLIEKAFEDPGAVMPGLEKALGPSLRAKWAALKESRRALLKLLSRFELSPDQAARFFQRTVREEAGIQVQDADLIANPYLLYLLDRPSPDPVALSAIDRGAFPDPVIREQHPLPQPSAMSDALDERRTQGLLASLLERASAEGDTLRTVPQLITAVRDLPLDPACPLDEDQIAIQQYGPALVAVETEDGTAAFQLDRLRDAGARIRSSIEKRLKGKVNEVEAEWAQLLDEKLPAGTDADEKRARAEKAAALEVLARSRISVLVGAAGTGKTTMLEVLCAAAEVRSGGILLLAPTGKARVQLSRRIDAPAKTIAQFLLSIDRYDPETGRCRMSDEPGEDGFATVIIDESSMLTEEQLAAVIDGLRGVRRLILVGDPRQLPPIGSGRPFLDIVSRLEPENIESRFPRSEGCYAELIVPRRPTAADGGEGFDAGGRSDLLLAEWFSGKGTSAGADEIWESLRPAEGEWLRDVDETLRVGTWAETKDLQEKLADLLAADLGLDGPDDAAGFERSLGASEHNGWNYFWREKGEGKPGAARQAESWQILSPVRGQPFGVRDLNRFVQHRYRRKTIDSAKKKWQRKIPKPMGPEEVIYGDKVINVENRRINDVFPKDGGLGYVANGEIGIAVGQFRSKNFKRAPWKLTVEFSSQIGFEYGFSSWAFGEEGSPQLELAYAITVHKSQGSEFESTYLVVPNPCPILSRELLYTALTRQRRKVTLLYQGDIGELKSFAGPEHGETATRLTNLFRPPKPVKVHERFLEDGLIHRTQRGDLVRSKSEVIIADLLHGKGVDYSYERKLELGDGTYRYPDFTIEDDESGLTIYWEHLGMLGDSEYRKRWERKLEWYRVHGILTAEEEGEREATLHVTADDLKGGIDAAAIAQSIDRLLGF